jgi:hypothetical protein
MCGMKIGLVMSNPSGEERLVAIDLPDLDAASPMVGGNIKALDEPILVTHVSLRILED